MKSACSRIVFVCIVSLFTSSFVAAADQTKIKGIGPVGEVKKLHTGFGFVEGPVADAYGSVYFTDIPNNRIHKVDSNGQLSVFVEPSGHANGLMFDGKARMLACQMDGQLVAIDMKSKKETIVAGKYDGSRFNAPNDLVVDQAGGVYFTDPHFRAPQPLPQGKMGVYYVDAGGKVTRLIDNLKAPNGVILSPDEKTLYVIPSLQQEMLAYPVLAPGKLGKGRVFCELKQPEGASGTGGDGLAVDTDGNLYITSRLGVQVYDSAGKLLGILKFPEQPANVAFGGKGNHTLYATARKSLYSVELSATGHVFPGKK